MAWMKSLVALGNCSSLGEKTTLKQVLFSLAVPTEPKNLYGVARLAKTVLFCDLLGPRFNLVRLDLNGLSAALADQVMVVFGGAGPIEQLSLL